MYSLNGFQVIRYLELTILVRIAPFYSACFKLLHVVFWSITKINQDNCRVYVLIVICGLGMLVISQNYFLIQSEDSSSQSYVCITSLFCIQFCLLFTIVATSTTGHSSHTQEKH